MHAVWFPLKLSGNMWSIRLFLCYVLPGLSVLATMRLIPCFAFRLCVLLANYEINSFRINAHSICNTNQSSNWSKQRTNDTCFQNRCGQWASIRGNNLEQVGDYLLQLLLLAMLMIFISSMTPVLFVGEKNNPDKQLD